MLKRGLRVLKWVGTTPAIAVCEVCGKQFKVPLTALSKSGDAQATLQELFDWHKCRKEDPARSAA
jgi:hypothetical protein